VAKKILVLLLGVFTLMIAAERMVLAELFTSTTCPPCVSGNATLTSLLNTREDYLAVVRFHMNWPSPRNDPFYHYNSGMNNTRRSFYGINAIPYLVVDGTVVGSSQGSWGSTIDTRSNVESPFDLNLYRDFTPFEFHQVQGEGSLLIEITNETDTKRTFILFGALTESNVHYTGTNGDPVHHQVVIGMLPHHYGTEITLEANETLLLEMEFDVNDTIPLTDGTDHIPDAEKCELMFWCQDVGTMPKEILQAAKVKVTGQRELLLSDIRVFDASGDGVLSPGEQADVHVTVTNGSDEKMENIHVFLEVDNEEITVVDGRAVVEEIAAGGSYTVEGNDLVIEASPDYDGSIFNFICRAGSGDGSMCSYTQPISVEEGSPSSAPFSLRVPTLVRDKALAELSVPAACDAELVLLDASGRRVKTLFSGKASAGVNIIALAFEGIPDGAYFIKATCGNYTRVEKLVILH